MDESDGFNRRVKNLRLIINTEFTWNDQVFKVGRSVLFTLKRLWKMSHRNAGTEISYGKNHRFPTHSSQKKKRPGQLFRHGSMDNKDRIYYDRQLKILRKNEETLKVYRQEQITIS
jgi:hypothetical protein